MTEVEFGRYRLIEVIGRGGMGEVWRAFDTVTERIVALKVLPAQYADDAMFQERFRREAKSAAALDEPHVVPIYDFGEIDGRLYVTMRLIKGRDLHAIVSEGPISPSRAVGIISQVASALHAAHQVNLVHRDVKPSNILVADDDFAYLIDFGIARIVGQTSITTTSGVIGTWAYMAPERISAGQTDQRADIYALSCVLYECLTARQPFGGDSLEHQIGGHLTLPPPRAADLQPDVPAELDAVIAEGMAKSPDQRFGTAREMARAARAALGEAPTGPHTLPPLGAAPTAHAATRIESQPGDSASPTQLSPTVVGSKPAKPKESKKRRLVALVGLGVVATVLAVVTAIAVVSHSGGDGTSRMSHPSAAPNTGPFTGTFTVAMGPVTDPDGGKPEGNGFSETWRLRSVCGANGCVATAVTGGQYPVKDFVFDNVDGRWLAVATSRWNCGLRDNDEAWNVVTLQQQSDGTMSGESIQNTANGCSKKRTVVMTRTADIDVDLLPDPEKLPPRVVSPAEALHGSYTQTNTYSGGEKLVYSLGVRTDCLRNGDRCMSFFSGRDGVEPFVYGNGSWTLAYDGEAPCQSGGTDSLKLTTTLLPAQPPQSPVMSLSGHGYSEAGGKTNCRRSRPDSGVKAGPSSLRCQHTNGWTRRARFPQSTSPGVKHGWG